MKKVRLFGRPGCHLCEEALDTLERLTTNRPAIDIEVVNIEEDRELHLRYLERIPVIEVDGEVVSELEPKADALLASLDTVGT